MKKSDVLKALLLSTPCVALYASEMEIPNTFSSGAAAVAAEVNANFTAAKTAVDDNNAKIEALQAQVEALEATVAQLQAAQPSTIASHVHPRLISQNYVDYSLDSGRGIFTVQFNVAMNTSSFVAGENVNVSGDGGTGTGVITWTHGNSTMIYTMNETFTSISPCFSGGLDLTIEGTGENPVEDMQGKPLDGDKDGLPGGDLVINYDIVC